MSTPEETGLQTRPPTRAERLRSWATWTVVAVPFLLIVASAGFAFVQLVPANPYHIYKTKLNQTVVCPFNPIQTRTLVEIEDTHTVTNIHIKSYWQPGHAVAADTSVPVYQLQPIEKTWRDSPVTRFAPPDPGLYRLHTDAEVGYNFYGIPRFHTETYVTENRLTVLSPTDLQCRRGMQ